MTRLFALVALFAAIAAGSALAAGTTRQEEPESVVEQVQAIGVLDGQVHRRDLFELSVSAKQQVDAIEDLKGVPGSTKRELYALVYAGQELAQARGQLPAGLARVLDVYESALASGAQTNLTLWSQLGLAAEAQPWARVDVSGALAAGEGVRSVSTGTDLVVKVTFERDVTPCAASVTPDTTTFAIGTARLSGHDALVSIMSPSGRIPAAFSLVLTCH